MCIRDSPYISLLNYQPMIFREAKINDISQIQVVRNAIKENTLSDPNLVTNNDVEDYLCNRGKGWVCEFNNEIVGFSIVDLTPVLYTHLNMYNRQNL